MCNANNAENLQLLLFDAGSGPETRQSFGVALYPMLNLFTNPKSLSYYQH